MPINTTEEYRALIGDLVQRTKSGDMEWVQVNPTTYSWSASKGQVSIQSIEKKRAVIESGALRTRVSKNHILFASDPLGRQQVRIDGGEEKEIEPHLKHLFDLAGDSIARKGLNFLKDLLDAE